MPLEPTQLQKDPERSTIASNSTFIQWLYINKRHLITFEFLDTFSEYQAENPEVDVPSPKFITEYFLLNAPLLSPIGVIEITCHLQNWSTF